MLFARQWFFTEFLNLLSLSKAGISEHSSCFFARFLRTIKSYDHFHFHKWKMPLALAYKRGRQAGKHIWHFLLCVCRCRVGVKKYQNSLNSRNTSALLFALAHNSFSHSFLKIIIAFLSLKIKSKVNIFQSHFSRKMLNVKNSISHFFSWFSFSLSLFVSRELKINYFLLNRKFEKFQCLFPSLSLSLPPADRILAIFFSASTKFIKKDRIVQVLELEFT